MESPLAQVIGNRHDTISTNSWIAAHSDPDVVRQPLYRPLLDKRGSLSCDDLRDQRG